jgi:mannose-6-phosphate isomerase-like protein (cupin superfamily)
MFIFYNFLLLIAAIFAKKIFIMVKVIKKVGIFFALYFIVGGLIFNHLFPPSNDISSNYFAQNQVLRSNVEGFEIDIMKVENANCYAKVTMKPHADGPPLHIHETFDEVFKVAKGKASIFINGEKKTLQIGEQIVIPRGTPHKPFNETDETVILMDSTQQNATMPVLFAYGLSRLYPAMDKIGSANSPKVMFQLAAQGNSFDTWIADAPIPAQKVIRWLLGPTARLLNWIS